jgi:hypothetical protein
MSKRNGQSKYLTSALKATGTKVQDLLSYFNDNRLVAYSAFASGSETTTWSTATPSKKDCLNVKVDRQGNVYALDGNSGLVKFSADKVKLWQLTLPVGDTNHIIRALAVDEFDRIYVGVSAGGLQDKAKLWCYEQLPDNTTAQLWEITTKAYVEDVVVSQGKLYTIQNAVDRLRSYVRVYDFIDETAPEQVQEWRVPHPANSIAVKADGSVVVASEAVNPTSGSGSDFKWRAQDPKYPELSIDSVDWTPYQLSNFDRRVWAWYVADDIDATDVASDFQDGVEILQWRDRTKNLRHLYAPIGEGTTGTSGDIGPQLALDSVLGHQGVRFTKKGNTSPLQALRSLPNASIEIELADQQRTMLPAYTNSSFALYIVCRPSKNVPPGDSTVRWLIGQDRTNTASASLINYLFVNASDTNLNSLPPTASAGKLFWFEGADPTSGGSGTSGQIKTKNFDGEDGRLCVITMVFDGLVAGDTQQSLFQLNGNPVDLFQSLAQASLEPTYVGIHRTPFASSPTAPSAGVAGYLGDILEILVLDRSDRNSASANVLTYDALEESSSPQTQTVNENTNILGYLEHKYGGQLNLPSVKAPNNDFPHPYGLTGSSIDFVAAPPNQAGTGPNAAQGLANKAWGSVVKYNPEGKIQWCANEMELESAARSGGYGYAVAVNSDGNIYSMGPNPTGAAGNTKQVRMIVDQGTDFSIATADGAWSADFDGNREQDYHYPRIDVDQFDNLYIPYNETSATAASVRVYSKTGTVLHSQVLASPQNATAVAVDRKIPDYRNDLTTKTVEHVIVAGLAAEQDLATLVKLRLVQATQTGASPRDLVTLGVSGGDIVKFTTAGVVSITGGTGALDASAYVQSTTLYKKAYWTDGKHLKVYDSVTNEITDYKSEGPGSMPDRCSLLESWRGRIVQARSADEPHNWFMSKKDEPNNYDYFPPVPGETDAVAGNNSPAGLCPDIINSVVPYSEDILVFGGDHSIWAMVGDPAAGGRLELVSDTTGMSFGRPWCKDPNGVLYFFGSMGGIFRWVPGSRPDRVSVSKIERQLQNVDLSTHYIRLIYNHRDEGIHILQLPFGAGGTQVSHWFYELKTESFAKDIFGTDTWTNVQPTAAMVIDGDAFDDRTVLFGGEDGFVRKWDRDSKRDDTRPDGSTPIAIDAFFTIFPLPGLQEEDTSLETQFSGLTVVLSEAGDGASYELFASEEPESMGQVRRKGTLIPGRNPPKWDRVTGPYCGLRIRNAAPDMSFAVERMYVRYSTAGMARPGKPR